MTLEERQEKEFKKYWDGKFPYQKYIMEFSIMEYVQLGYLEGYKRGKASHSPFQEEIDTLLNFIPDDWPMPLGWNQLIAQIKEAR